MLTKWDAVQKGDVVRVRASVKENAEWRGEFGPLGIVVDAWTVAVGDQIVFVRPVFQAGTAFLGKATVEEAGVFSRNQVRPLLRIAADGTALQFKSTRGPTTNH